jgi:hypothetical protein
MNKTPKLTLKTEFPKKIKNYTENGKGLNLSCFIVCGGTVPRTQHVPHKNKMLILVLTLIL